MNRLDSIENVRQFDKKSKDEEFCFEVFGEDSSCGGMNDRPIIRSLGHYQGTAVDVYRFAETLSGWKSWGRGGELKLYTPPVIHRVDREAVAKRRLKSLEYQELLKKKLKLEKEINEFEQ